MLNAGNLQLQALAADGSTFVNCNAIEVLGTTTFDLPPGQYRFNIPTSTANHITIVGVPYIGSDHAETSRCCSPRRRNTSVRKPRE